MEKVVILVRVSTEKQEYQRQINELTEYCSKVNWQIEKIFANKISGALKNEEREEICELVEFVKNNNIRRVVCLEISRIGRNTLEALKIIQFLNENKISLYVKKLQSRNIGYGRKGKSHCFLNLYYPIGNFFYGTTND